MSQSPFNLLIRFLLELAALAGLFRLGVRAIDGGSGILVGVLLAAVALAAWGTFNVPGDPSRSGKTPVQVRGVVRLGLELVLLCGGALGWWLAGPVGFAWGYSVALVVHYAASWDRVAWLVGPDTNRG